MVATKAEMTVPHEDLTRQYALLAPEIREAIDDVLPRGKYTLGPQLAAFEQEFAAYCGAAHGIGISSGTAALHLALRAVGVGEGDEVITVPNTYAATVFSITYCSAVPVFVDIDPRTFNIDPSQVEAAITDRTKAILVVDLYGLPADYAALREIAQRRGLALIEDSAQSHGSTYHEQPAGSLGDIACFSFYPSKNLGAFGDGGFITTSDDRLNERVRQLRYMGQKVKHDHEILGYQERLDEIQAAILRVKLRHLDGFIANRRKWAARYDRELRDTPMTLPVEPAGTTHSYYMYTVRAPRRDELRAYLDEQGVGTQVIYPRLVPDQRAYVDHPYRSMDIPNARAAVPELLCLPVFPELREDEVAYVVDRIRRFYDA